MTKKRYDFRLNPKDYKKLMEKVKARAYNQRQNQLGLYLEEIANKNVILVEGQQLKVIIQDDR